MNQYRNGQAVRSLTNAQGLTQGAEYTVVDVQVRSECYEADQARRYEADQARRAACSHPDVIELLDGVTVCTCCEAVR